MYDHELERRKQQIRSGGLYADAMSRPEPDDRDTTATTQPSRLRHVLTITGAVLIVTICIMTVVGIIPLYLIARATAWTELRTRYGWPSSMPWKCMAGPAPSTHTGWCTWNPR